MFVHIESIYSMHGHLRVRSKLAEIHPEAIFPISDNCMRMMQSENDNILHLLFTKASPDYRE